MEAEAGGEANGAGEAEVVFGKAEGGVADGAEDAGVEVGQAADVVEDGGGEGGGGGQGVEKEAVDGEVAALDVFLGAEGVLDGVGAAAVRVCAVGAEGGDFGDDFAAVGFVGDEDDAEVRADGEGAGEEVEDDGGGRAGGDVVVLGGEAEEEVADASAGEPCLIPGLAEPLEDGEGGFGVWRVGQHGAGFRVRQGAGVRGQGDVLLGS